MAKSLAKLFDGDDDSALCGHLFNRLSELHGDRADAAHLPEEERTVYLVCRAISLISNGGFRYLFEFDVEGDLHYVLTRQAFKAIGSVEAEAAFERTLALFPSGRPPSSLRMRLSAYHSRINGWPTPEDELFIQAISAIERCLAKWVRSRRRAFAHLK